MEKKLPKGALGGQAVMEGVMMKGPDGYSVAVRRPDQKIEVTWKQYKSVGDRHAFCKLPLIRGVVNFVESVTVGMKTLSYSSAIYEEDEVETKADRVFRNLFKEKSESVMVGVTVVFSILLAVALFMLLPAGLAELLGNWITSRILLSVIEGIFRITIFLLYVIAISKLEDIKRVFMYHGAEHKTINCYEAGDELTPEKVAGYSRYHKRCGTSFMFIVMIISIFVFMFITAEQMWMRLVLRLLLVPVVASISYEFIRMAGRHDNAFWNVLSKPGMWVQQLTTKEPTEEMLQVAIVSVEAVLYGKPYVKAVNEAQGIGLPEEKESKDTVDHEAPQEETEESGLSQSEKNMQFGGIVLGDDLDDEAEEDEFLQEEDYEDGEERNEIKAQPEQRTSKKRPVKHNPSQTQTDRVEDVDLSEFEKSFFED